MASWKKYFTNAPSSRAHTKYLDRVNSPGAFTTGKIQNYLPEVYAGAPNRLERYVQYDQMDLDGVIHRAMDIIAEFSTQTFDLGDEPFRITFKDINSEISESEIKILKTSLSQWCSLNEWQRRLFKAFRNCIVYGDLFFIRDPDTFKLLWIDPSKVDKIIVNESKGKSIEQYSIRDVDPNLMSLVGANPLVQDQYSFPGGYPRSSVPAAGAGSINYGMAPTAGSRFSRFANSPEQTNVDASHVLHLSLSEGLDSQWPFGLSILESIYKTWKQKDLIQDCILIYRLVRAPERRVWYIDTGSLKGAMAQQFVERMKSEMWQRRIPNRKSDGGWSIDSSYSPLSPTEDYYLAVNAEGKGTKIDTLPSGSNLDQINDLLYWDNLMMRSLGIPSSYLPTGPEDSQAVYSDGKTGTAYIQEFCFGKYCQRLQNLMAPTFDREFKLFLKFKGVEIPASYFELQFHPPQSFSQYRQIQLDTEQIQVYSSIMSTVASKFLSQRWAMERYLGMTKDEIITNERMFKEENPSKIRKITGRDPDSKKAGLNSVGVTPEPENDDFNMNNNNQEPEQEQNDFNQGDEISSSDTMQNNFGTGLENESL